MVAISPKMDRHRISFRVSCELTSNYRRVHQPGALAVDFEEVVAHLVKAKVKCVLMGTHGIMGWMKDTRYTQDVDVLIAKRDHAKAIRTIKENYPTLEMEDSAVVTRFKDPGLGFVVIDLMKPSQTVFEMILRNSIAVRGGAYKIPSLEMALVSKFAAITSPNRNRRKKITDVSDFFEMIEAHGDDIDFSKLDRLADMVYKGGAREVRKLIDDYRENRPIQI